jgi:hypothetical protein
MAMDFVPRSAGRAVASGRLVVLVLITIRACLTPGKAAPGAPQSTLGFAAAACGFVRE